METIVIRFRYENLRNEAHVELHETVKSLLEQLSPEQLGIATQCGEYRSLLDTEVAALDVIRRSERTLEIEEQDHRRDSIYRGLAEAVKSSLHHFDPAKQEAARRVEVIVEHYGNIAAKTLDQETAALDDLRRELLDAPEHAALVATLGLNDWLDQLHTENQRFKNLMQERYAEAAQRPTTHMKAARAAVDKAFRSLLDRVEALVIVNGMGNYETFVRDLNAIMERYKTLLARQHHRKPAAIG